MSGLKAIYLDMDGVLCDMVGPSLRVHAKPDLLATWPKGTYDLEAAIGVSMDEFWAKIDAEGYAFWANLPAYDWIGDLISAAKRSAPEFMLLTKPSRSYFSSGGKHEWITKWLGRNFRNYAITPFKHHMAGPGRLLVDDSEKNIREWEAAGGIGLVFPQPWNHAEGDISTVLAEISRLASI